MASSSASQQSRVLGRRRNNKRAGPRDPAVAQTIRVPRECQSTLTALARLEHQRRLQALARMEQEHHQAHPEALADEIDMLAADDFGDVVEDGIDDGGSPPVPEASTYNNFVVVRDADRKRCERCHKVLPQDAVPEASFLSAGSVCNTVSDVSVLSPEDQEVEADGVSS